MSQQFLTLEKEGGGTKQQFFTEDIPVDEGIEAAWSRHQRQADQFFDNRYMTSIPSEVLRQHPEGGCLVMKPIPGHPTDAVSIGFSTREGFYCFPKKRPGLFEAQAQIPAGADIFASMYGDYAPETQFVGSNLPPSFIGVPAEEGSDIFAAMYGDYAPVTEFVGGNLPPSFVRAPVEDEGLGMYPYEMDSLGRHERQQLADHFDDGDLSGFWKRVGRAFKPPRNVRKFFKRVTRPPKAIRKASVDFRKAYKKGLRYYGATLATTMTLGMMPASTRNRMFGLRGKEQKQFNKFAKVTKVAAIVVGTVATGGAAVSMMATAPAIAGTVGVAGKGMWLAKTGGVLMGIAKSQAGMLAIKALMPGQTPPEAEMIPEGGIIGTDEFYDPSFIGMSAPSVAGMPGITDTPWNEPSLTDALLDAPAPKAAGLKITPTTAMMGMGVLALLVTLRR